MTTRTKIPRWTMLALAGALLAFGGVARAGDEGEDAASLVRRARTAEAVDRDAPKAITLYRKAIEVGGSGDAARDASLRLARLLEQSAKAPEALEAWKALSERFGDRLADAEKKEAHEAIGRLLPPGGHARSPLGEVYVRAAGDAASPAADVVSPMDAKIVAMLAEYEAAGPEARGTARSEMIQILRPVGADAVPALTRALRTENPVRARLAAELVAMFGGVKAVESLERTLLEGDPFARGAALEGLAQVAKTPETSAALVAAVDRMLAVPALADRRPRLREIAAPHLDDKALLARFEAGGEGAAAWLTTAVKRNAALAAAKVVEVTKRGGAIPSELLDSLAAAAGGRSSGHSSESGWSVVGVTPTSTALDAEARSTILKILLADEPTAIRLGQAAAIAGTLNSLGPPEAAKTAALDTWNRVLAVSDPALRRDAAQSLTAFGVWVPAEALNGPEALRAYEELLATFSATKKYGTDPMEFLIRRPAARAGARFWGPFLRAMSMTGKDEAWNIALSLFINKLDRATLAKRVAEMVEAVEGGVAVSASGARFLAWAAGGDVDNWEQQTIFPRTNEIDLGLRVRVLKLLLPRTDAGAERWIAEVVALILRSGDTGTTEAARRDAWALVVSRAEEPAIMLAFELLRMAVAAPADLYRDAKFRERLAHAWVRLAKSGGDGSQALNAAAADALAVPEVWDVMFAAATIEGADKGAIVLDRIATAVPDDAPGFADLRWLDVIAGNGQPRPFPSQLALRGGARTNDSRFLETLRRGGLMRAADPATANSVAYALITYGGPGRIEAIRAAALDPAFLRQGKEVLARGLGSRPIGSPEHALLLELALKAQGDASIVALKQLTDLGDREGVTRVVLAQTGPAARAQDGFRAMLVQAASALHLREAIPFLLEQFRSRGSEGAASAALDSIRSYYERAALYEDLAQGAGERKKDLTKLLEDADPEIRRAAVLSLGAMGDKEALPRLVRIAKEEKDPRVRAAALEAVERIARSPPPAPPSSPAPPPSPAPAMSDEEGR